MFQSEASSPGIRLRRLRETDQEGKNALRELCRSQRATERMVSFARIGRKLAHTVELLAKEGEEQRQHAVARSSWNMSSQPVWLTAEVYSQEIQPRLTTFSNPVIASTIGVSRWYAGRIRQGYRPHPRHWQHLAELARMAR